MSNIKDLIEERLNQLSKEVLVDTLADICTIKQKINIAELLKDCPKGMELDCTMFENVTFVRVDMSRKQFPIEIAINGKLSKYLTKEGCFHDVTLLPDAKCVIFPKGKTNWEGFQRPFKDGDVCCAKTEKFEHIFIFKVSEDHNYIQKYANLSENNFYINENPLCTTDCVKEIRFATEEEEQKLFDAIKAKGYKWNAVTKTFVKLIEPKFKVGDKIENSGYKFTIIQIKDNFYLTKCGNKIPIVNQNDFILVPNKFDINTLKPFDKVLVRVCDKSKWIGDFYLWYNCTEKDFPYNCVCGCWSQCVLFKGNEHLLGKTDDCDDFYKTW